MMFEVGERLAMKRELCRGRSEDEIRRKCNYTVVPGAVYEIVYVLEQPIKRENLPKIYYLLKDLEARFVEVGVNYIGVSDDGKQVIFQIFDPPGIAGEIIGVIVALILIFLILYLGIPKAGEVVVKILPIPEPLKPVIGTLFWLGLSLALIGFGVGMILRGVRGR
jgi:hypothetical protein